MKYIALFVLLGMCFFAGCATRPVSNDLAVSAPKERILDDKYINPIANAGQITIKRDSGIGGAACSSRIFINGQPTADIYTSEKIILYLPEGEYILSAWPNGICGGRMSEVKTSIKNGSKSTFRVGYGTNGDFFISPTAF
jgi:hypothetical protein